MLIIASSALFNITACMDNRTRLGTLGGVATLTQLLRRRGGPDGKATLDSDVIERVCGALSNGTCHMPANHRLCGAAGGVAALCDVLRDYMDNPLVCEQACGVLWNICADAQNMARSAELDVVRHVVAVVRKHLADEIVVCLLYTSDAADE